MTVRELKEILNRYDENEEVLLKSENNRYVDGIAGARRKEISAFWGEDRTAVILVSSGQEGSI